MTLFILHHLLAVTLTTGAALAVILAYQAGSIATARRLGVPGSAPCIRLVWAADTPVAVVSNPTQADQVAVWLAAVKEGTVVRV